MRQHPFSRKQQWQDDLDTYILGNVERNSIISRLARYAVKKKGRYVIILVNRIVHLKTISKRLSDVPHRLVYGKKEVINRRVAVKKFEKGKIRLIIASRVFQKGVDIKRVDVIINGGARKDRNAAIQAFGRGVRLHQDKDGLLYFDIADQDPALVPAKDKNRYHVAAQSRKHAFKSVGIPVLDYEWNDDIVKLYRSAETFLRRGK